MKKLFACLLLIVFPVPAGAILPGPMKDFFTARQGDTTAIVFGTRGVDASLLEKIELLAHRNADFLKQKDPKRIVAVFADTAFPVSLFSRRSVVLMGSTKSNQILARWKKNLPFLIRDGRFNITGRKLYSGEDIILSYIFPNPFNHDRYLLLLAGNEAWAQPALSDWEGDYDYFVAQRHSFPKEYLDRGKFEKTTSFWSHTLTEYAQIPRDPMVLVSLIYPHGKIWYPYRWELDSLWKDPIPERVRLLENVNRFFSIFEQGLGMRIWGDVDFHLSEDYPRAIETDPLGRVFVRTRPEQMEPSVFFSWGRPLTRVLISCSDAPLDWELFCHRYLLAENLYPSPNPAFAKVDSAQNERGRYWLATVTEGDSTHLSFLQQLAARGLQKEIGAALDRIANQERYSFKMREFLDVLTQGVADTSVRRLAQSSLRPSPYGRTPAHDLGIKNPGELFLTRAVIVGEVAYRGKAHAAGLRKGDQIVLVDGFPTSRNRSRAYLAWLGKKKGQTLKLEVMRKGTKHAVLVPVG